MLFKAGVPENMYQSNLPKVIQSRYGFVGCLASLDLGGEALNPLSDALVPSNMVVAGCEGTNIHIPYTYLYNLELTHL